MTPRLPSSAAMTFAVTVVAAVVAALTLTLTGCADTAGIDSHARLRDAASLGLEGGAASNPATPSADPAEARAIHQKMVDLLWWVGGPRYVAGTKAALGMIGLDCGPPRPPRLPLPEAMRPELQRVLAALDLPAIPA